MKQPGTAIAGIPVYSNPDPLDFLYHWLRISWAAILPGRLLDDTGDTAGYYVCSVRNIGYPILKSTHESRGHYQIELETSVTALAHTAAEESALAPESAFALSELTRTLCLTFDVATNPAGFVVQRATLRPHSAEAAALVHRYGGGKLPYIWPT